MVTEEGTLWTPEKIIQAVHGQEMASEDLRRRMEADYGRYLLEWTDDRWERGGKPEDYHTYISNEPRTYADRMVELLVSSDMIARVPYGDLKAPERVNGEAKERFFQWALRQADESLLSQVLPTLKQQLSFYIMLRGWYAGRAILYKKPDGSTCADITPFDPLHTFFAVGRHGLAWLCHRAIRTREELRDDYGIPLDDSFLRLGGDGEGEDGIPVYDFYDQTTNYVVVGKDFAKDPAPHGAGRVPCFTGLVGARPFIQRKDELSVKDILGEVGESVFSSNRNVYDAVNKMEGSYNYPRFRSYVSSSNLKTSSSSALTTSPM
mgnify:FL=1